MANDTEDDRFDKLQTKHLAQWWARQLEDLERTLEYNSEPPMLTADPGLDSKLMAMHYAKLALYEAKVRVAQYCVDRLEK